MYVISGNYITTGSSFLLQLYIGRTALVILYLGCLSRHRARLEYLGS